MMVYQISCPNDTYITDYVQHRIVFKDETITPATGDNISSFTYNNQRTKSDIRRSHYNKRGPSRTSKNPSKLSNYSVSDLLKGLSLLKQVNDRYNTLN